MSLAQLNNAPWLSVNVNKQYFTTGATMFLGTAGVATQNLICTVMNNIVTIDFNFPDTNATGTVLPITFANALPVQLRPSRTMYIPCMVQNTTAGVAVGAYAVIPSNGTISVQLLANSVNGNGYRLQTLVSYSLN